MPVAKKNSISGIEWTSGEKAAALLDARARRVLKISGEEFISQWKAGKFRDLDSDACPGVIELALLAPKVNGSRGRKKQSSSDR